MSRTKLAALAAATTLGLGVLHAGSAGSEQGAAPRRRATLAPVPDDAPPRPDNLTACNYQDPKPFLIRGNFVPRGRLTPEERQARRELHAESIRYRTERYGYFKGFGRPEWNPHPPSHYARWTTFMEKRVQLHERVIPALACVEEQIRQECAAHPYRPGRLSGLRTKNTYHTDEVSNHLYGIAIDVDPTLNTCCGCVGSWPDHPLCKREVASIYDRMAMPACWVHVFERFGFYWLGRDRLQDTMHFEFLGEPERISKSSAAAGKAPPTPADGGTPR